MMAKRKNAAAVSLGRRGGRVTSEKKAAACRLNGLKAWSKRKALDKSNRFD